MPHNSRIIKVENIFFKFDFITEELISYYYKKYL